ncbi:MAG: copper-translocating P-type ATPase [Oscillospiraceae bacterium]|nr:copper-translocating P-type ATPase [Oscillospiraceae bacterium]
MRYFDITGMNCAACSARVEKAVTSLEGVEICAVNLLTNSMGVEGSVTDAEIIKAVKKAGYGIAPKRDKEKGDSENALADNETPELKRRLMLSCGFLLVLMYISMGYNMWSLPLPEFFEKKTVFIAIAQMLLAGVVILINRKFYINGVKGIIKRAPNMDTLVAMGSFAAFAYSIGILISMWGNPHDSKHMLHELYFESSAMILVLITVGKMLEAKAKGKTTDAIRSLMSLAPKTATVIVDGKEKEVGIEEIKKGDIFVVKSGESIPVDGIVLEGSSAVNEAALTGESVPVDKEKGDEVKSATLNLSGFIKCRATRVGEDTTLAQIIRTVREAAATKAPVAKAADRVSGIFVPIVIGIAGITTGVWLICGESLGFSLARGISVLVISCPCALGLATPVAIMVGSGVGARNGILFKTAEALEMTGRAKVVALDKTGTITKGEPEVTDIITSDAVTESELMSLAVSIEKKSEHPLASAVVKRGYEDGVAEKETGDFEVLSGSGVRAKIDGKLVMAGNYKFVKMGAKIPDNLKKEADRLADEGKTPMFFASDGECVGIIAVADVIKSDSYKAILDLRDMGIHVVMLTGDNERTARAIGNTAGVSEVIAGLLPNEKEKAVAKLSGKGCVVMVGDGINDAPALVRADVGIAIGAGAEVAMDAADVVLMKSGLSDLAASIRLSKATLRNIHQNLFWAFLYNVICIPFAAGVFVPFIGIGINPMFGAAAMSISSFCVVSNALRLNFAKIHAKTFEKS